MGLYTCIPSVGKFNRGRSLRLIFSKGGVGHNHDQRVGYSIHVSPVAGDPTLTSLEQISSTTVRVMWIPPSGGATVTGYGVHYRSSGSVRIKSVLSSSTSTDITGLTSGATYTISVEATSHHLSGESEEMTITLSEWIYSSAF